MSTTVATADASPVKREPTSALLRRRRSSTAVEAAHERRAQIRRAVDSALRHHGAPPSSDADFDAAFNLALWNYARALEGGQEVENVTAWLATTASREVLRTRRRLHNADVALGVDDAASMVSDDALDEALHLDAAAQQTLRMLTTLPERSRQVVVMQRVQGMARGEVAEALGISEKAVKKAMEKAAPVLSRLQGYRESDDLCGDVVMDVRAYALGNLDRGSDAYRATAAHLRSCPTCRAIVRESRGLQAVLPPLVPAVFSAGVLERLAHYGDEIAGGATAALGGGGTVAAVGSTAGGGAVGSGLVGGLSAKVVATCVAGAVCVGGGAGVREAVKDPPKPKKVVAAAAASSPTASAAPSSSAVALPVSTFAVMAQRAESDIAAAKRRKAARERAAAKRAAAKRAAAAKTRRAERDQERAAAEFAVPQSGSTATAAGAPAGTAVAPASQPQDSYTSPTATDSGGTGQGSGEFGVETP